MADSSGSVRTLFQNSGMFFANHHGFFQRGWINPKPSMISWGPKKNHGNLRVPPPMPPPPRNKALIRPN